MSRPYLQFALLIFVLFVHGFVLIAHFCVEMVIASGLIGIYVVVVKKRVGLWII